MRFDDLTEYVYRPEDSDVRLQNVVDRPKDQVWDTGHDVETALPSAVGELAIRSSAANDRGRSDTGTRSPADAE